VVGDQDALVSFNAEVEVFFASFAAVLCGLRG
jgi:hypothetical protein